MQWFFFSSFHIPGGSFPCLQRVCCKPEAHIRMALSNLIDKQVELTSGCEPGVSVFSEAGGLFSDPRVCFAPPPSLQSLHLDKGGGCALGLIAKLPCMPSFPTGHVESDCSLLTFLHVRLKQCWHMTSAPSLLFSVQSGLTRAVFN